MIKILGSVALLLGYDHDFWDMIWIGVGVSDYRLNYNNINKYVNY